jgi:hypothetical protein
LMFMMVTSCTCHSAFDSSFLLPHVHMKLQEKYTLQNHGSVALMFRYASG